MRLYRENPSVYAPQSYSNVNTAKVISIITLILSGMITLFYLLYFLIYGALIGTALFGAWQADSWDTNTNSYEDDASWDQEVVDDWGDDSPEIENDTLLIESIELDSVH